MNTSAASQAVLSLDNVHMTYPHPSQPVTVLQGLSLTVMPGDTVSILGPSGSGKSTLLALAAGLDHPSSGAVNFLGQNLAKLSEASLARLRGGQLGIVFQQFHLLSQLTAFENIALPLQIFGHKNVTAKVEKVLQEVGLGLRADHFPHEMSGGECQRVAIARALVLEPPLLLADEPSGSLDQKTGEQVMELLFSLTMRRRTALVLVTHNLAHAARCQVKRQLQNGVLTPL